MYWVYILKDEKEEIYIGYTSNLERRIKEHQAGYTRTTRLMGKKRLIYYEAFISREDAVRREKYLKTTKGKKGLKLILRDTLKIKHKCWDVV